MYNIYKPDFIAERLYWIACDCTLVLIKVNIKFINQVSSLECPYITFVAVCVNRGTKLRRANIVLHPNMCQDQNEAATDE